MKTRQIGWVVALLLAAALVGASAALAGAVDWIGGNSNIWSDSGNWSGAPTGNDVTIAGGFNQPVVLDATDSVNSLSLGGIGGSGELTISANTLTVAGSVNLGTSNSGTINLNGTGTLNATSILPGTGTSAINFNGGTLTAATIGLNLVNAGGTLRPGGSDAIGTTLFGSPPSNVALGKATYQVSECCGGTPGRAVDGNTNGNWGNGSVTHTNSGAVGDWWRVDLGSLNLIEDIKLWNRTDCCSDRLSNFHVSIFDDEAMTNEVWRKDFYTGGGYPSPTLDIPNINVSGRWVQVQLNGTNNLSLAEVQIYAPGLLDYTQGATGTLAMKVDGSTGTADKLNVLGNLTPGGTLNVTALNGRIPQPGTNFQLLKWGTISATTFSAVNNLVGHGLGLDASALYTTGSISFTPNTWKLSGSGTWNDTASWSGAYIPVTANDSASFLGAITAPSTVTVANPATVGWVNFDNANKYTVTGSPITMEVLGGAAGIAAANGSHDINNALTLNSHLQVSVANDGNMLTLGGPVSEGAAGKSLTKSGAGALKLAASNTFTGGVTINGGAVQLGHAGALNAATPNPVAFSGSNAGKLQLNGNSVTIGGLSGGVATPGSTVVENANAAPVTLTVNGGGNYVGSIQDGAGGGSLTLVKTGSGTLTLSGTNTYGGTTTITQGTLKIIPAAAPVSGMLYWLDPSNPASLVTDGTNVTGLNDLSPNGRNFTVNGGTAPSLASNAFGTLPAVHFNGSSTTNRLDYIGSVNAQTVFIVNRPAGNDTGLDGIWGWPGNDKSIRLRGTTGWNGNPGSGDGNDFTNSGGGTTYITTASTFDVNTTEYGGYGTAHIIAAYGNMTFTDTALGYAAYGNRYFRGDMGEVLVYGTQLSAADRQQVENYLKAKWFGAGAGGTAIPPTSAVSIGAAGTLDLTAGFRGSTTTIGTLSGEPGGQVTLGNGTLAVTSTADSDFAGGISGPGNLTKNGPATLTLSGVGAFTGDTRIAAGTLKLGVVAPAVQSLALQFSTLDMNAADAGSIDWGGLDVVLGGLKGTRDLTLAAGKTLTIGGNNLNTAYSGILTGNAAVTKLGTGTLSLSGANAYSGATTITDGAVNVGNGIGIGVPANSLLVFNGTGSQTPVLEARGTFSRTIGAAAGNVQWTGHGGFAAKGGTLAVQLNGGALDWTATIGDSRNLVLNSTTADNVVDFQNGLNLGPVNRTIVVNDNTGSTADLGKISGVISGSGGIIKTGAGTLNLAGNNTFTGGLTLNAGAVQVGNTGALNAATPNAVAFAANSSGKLQLKGNSVTVSGLTTDAGSPGSAIVENASTAAATLTVNKATGLTDTFAGVLQDGTGGGKLSLTKAGPGRLDLSGTNTLTGQLNVTGGTLGGTAKSLTANVVLSNNANITFNQAGDDKFSKTISGTGSLTKDGVGTLTVLSPQTYSGPTVITNGTLKLTPMVLNPGINASIFDASAYGYELLDLDGATYTYPATRCFSGSTRLLALTPTSSAVKYMGQVSGFGMFAGLPADKHATGFSGTIVPPVTGSYNFRWSDDDRGHMYIDMDNNGVFEAGEAVAANAWDANGNKSLNAGQLYNFIYMSMDGGGGESNNFWVTIPGKGEQYVNPSVADQTGMWNQLEPGNANNTLPTTTAVSVAGGATFDVGGVTQTISSLSDYNGSGGSVKLGGATLTINNANNCSFSGVISGAGGLTKTGLGTLTLNGASAQTYVGPTKVLSGGLTLDFSNLPAPTDMIPGTSALTLAGSTLIINGKADPASGTSQTFSSLTLNAGAAAVRVTNNGLAANVALGTVVRNPGATVAFTLPSAGHIFGSSANFFANAVLLDANGAAFATAGSSDWAAMDGSGSEIVTGTAAGVYTLASGAGGNFGDAQSIDMDVSTELTLAGVPDSIRFNLALASNLNLKGNDLSVGGILVTPGMGAQATTIEGAGKLRGRNPTADLVLIQNNTSAPLVINSVIADPIAGVTKSGPGELVLGGANTFTAPLLINEGKVWFSGAGASVTYPIVFGEGGTGVLQLRGNPLTVLSLGGDLTGGSSAVENFSATAAALTVNNSTDIAYGGMLRDGAGSAPLSLVKDNTGVFTISGNNSFTGGVTIKAGALRVGGPGALNAAQPQVVTFSAGGTGKLQMGGSTAAVGGLVEGTTGASIIENAASAPGTLVYQQPGATTDTYAGTLRDGAGGGKLGVTKAGNGTLVLTGVNSFTGPATVTGGTLKGNVASISGPIVLANGAGVVFDQGADAIYEKPITGAGSLTKTGGGTLSLKANSSFAGSVSVNEGTLKLNGYSAPSGAALWLDATNASSMSIAGGLVSEWRDTTGGADRLVQGDVNRQPTYVSSGINGLPVVRFSTSGTADLLNNSTDYRGQPFTILSVSKLNGGSNGRLISCNGNNWLLGYHGNYVDRFYFEGWVYGEPGVSAADTRAHMYEASIPGTGQNSTVWVYDDRNPAIRQLASNQSGVTAPLGLQLSGYNGANELSDGDVGEILIYRKVLTAEERAAAENYLIAKWFGSGASFDNLPDTGPVFIAPAATLDVNGTKETIGPLSGTGTLALGTGTLTVNCTSDSVFPGTVTGTGVLAKSGAGTFKMTGTWTSTVGLGVDAGTWDLGGRSLTVGSLSGTGGVITDNAATSGTSTLTVNQTGTTTTYAGTISNGPTRTLALVKDGAGTTILTGASGYTGGTTLLGGALGITDLASINGNSAPINFNGGRLGIVGTSLTTIDGLSNVNWATFNGGFDILDAAHTFTLGHNLVGSGGLSKGGPGKLVVSGNNSYSGPTTVNAGTLVLLGNYSAASTVTLNAGILAIGGDTTVTPTSAPLVVPGGTSDVTFSAPISVGNTLNLTLSSPAGAGALTLGNVRFQATTVGNPRSPWTNTLFVTSASGKAVVVNSLGAGPGVLDMGSIDLQNGNKLRIAGPNHLGGFMVLGSDGSTGADATQNGTTLEIASDDAFGTSSTVFARNIVNSAVPWDQAVYVWNGVLKGVGGPHTLSGRNLNMRINAAFTGDNLTFAEPGLVRSAGAHTLFVENTTTFSNGIFEQNGGQSIIKAGLGTLVIGGTDTSYTRIADGRTYGPFNRYTSGTTVNAGTLRFATAAAKPASGPVTVATGARLEVNAGGTNEFTDFDLGNLVGAALFNPNSVLGIDTTNAAAGFDAASTIYGNFALAKMGPNTLTLSGINSYTGGTTVNAGTLRIASVDALPAGGSLTIGAGSTVVLSSGLSAGAGSAGAAAPVPEPGTLVLLGAGALAGVLLCLRRRVK